MAEEPEYDVAVNVHKGADGYGIYFNSSGGIIKVTKLDADSEAVRAGVQRGDEVRERRHTLNTRTPGSLPHAHLRLRSPRPNSTRPPAFRTARLRDGFGRQGASGGAGSAGQGDA